MGFTGGGGNDARIRFFVKTVDQIINDEILLQPNTGLTGIIIGEGRYLITIHTRYASSVIADMEQRLSLPLSTGQYVEYASIGGTQMINFGSSAFHNGGGIVTPFSIILEALADVPAGGDVLTLTWAQVIADPTDSTMFAGSCMEVKRVG